MTIEISKPFAQYVVIQELSRTAGVRKFSMHLPYIREGGGKIEHWRREWTYSGAAEAESPQSGFDRFQACRQRELEVLKEMVEMELRVSGERLFEAKGQRLLLRGRAKKRR
jgi:hypothetical protein